MELKYKELNIKENDSDETAIAVFDGQTGASMTIKLQIRGDKEEIDKFLKEHKITAYNQVISAEFKNNQKTLAESTKKPEEEKKAE